MSNRTRYFMVGAGLVLTVGLGTGLVAYYSGELPHAMMRHDAGDWRTCRSTRRLSPTPMFAR